VCFFTGYHSKSSSAVCCSAWAIVVPEKASLGLSDCGNYRSSGEVEKILWTAGILGRELVHISVRKRPVRSGLGLGRPAWAFFAAGRAGLWATVRLSGPSDRAWPDCRYLQAFE